MRKIGSWLLKAVKTIWFMIPKYVLVIVALAFSGLGITKIFTPNPYYSNIVFVIILFGLLFCVILYVAGKEIYKWVKKGNYANKNKKR